MAFFHNDRENLVPDMVAGILATADVDVLDTPVGTILVRSGHEPGEEVAIVSGGGSGHEPAHAGFLGEGMLTAAIPGSLFASPPVGAVLEAIRAVTGPAGCLLVIKNYTGDRLNFGLAAERAREEGYRVRTVLVGDDVALPDLAQPRGLAGTILVHKAAGHVAARGGSLDEVTEAAERTARGVRTMGLALSPASLPGEGQPGAGRGPELGLGIHNEPGARSVEVGSAGEAVRLVLEALDARTAVEKAGGDGLVVVLNDLGGCSPQEGLILVGEVLSQLGQEHVSRLIGPARLMTSLDMHGFSLTLAPATAELVEALESPTTAPAWAVPHAPRTPAKRPVTQGPAAAEPAGASAATSGRRLEEAVARACRALREASEELDDLDRVAGDADAGTTFGAGAAAVAELIADGALGFAEPAAALRRIARRLETAMGGSSGVLLAILFTAVARSLDEGEGWASALTAGIEAMQHHGGAEPGDRTMLDALVPAQQQLAAGGDPAEVAAAARRGADGTAELAAQAGRAAYVPDSASRGTPDAGAVAVALFLEALAEAL